MSDIRRNLVNKKWVIIKNWSTNLPPVCTDGCATKKKQQRI